MDLSRHFSIHPVGLVTTCNVQDWPAKRALYQAAKKSGRLATRADAAARIDLVLVEQAEYQLTTAAKEYRRLLDVIVALPLEPDAETMADLTEARKVLERARCVRRKVDLLNDCTQGFTRMLGLTADVGLMQAAMKAGKDGEEGIDFSKLTALQIVLNQAPSQPAQRDVTPVETRKVG